MAKVRVRPETGNLYLDFSYRGVRCREQTALPDTPQNRNTLEGLATRIKRDLAKGQFQYRTYFPDSSRVTAFDSPAMSTAQAAPASDQPPVTQMTFREASEVWFAENKPLWRHTNATTTQSILDKRLLPVFGDKPVDTISRADLLEFRARTIGSTNRKGQESLSASRVNHIMGVARMVLTDASDKLGFVSPYRNIKPVRSKKAEIEPFTLDEVERMLAAVRADYRPYLTLRFFTGLRSGEANALEWKHVDFDNDVIRVRQVLVRDELVETKTDGSTRDVPMIPSVRQALLEQRKITPEDSRWVFVSPEGGPINLINFTNRVWHPLLRHLGLRSRRPYQTRHTAATLMLAAGENPEWVARTLGHSSTEMLFRVYSRYVPNLTRNDGRAFTGLVTGGSAAVDNKAPASLAALSRTQLEALIRQLEQKATAKESANEH